MANERGEEIKWKFERQRLALRLGTGLIVLIAALYFVVNPIASAFDVHLDLPEWRLVLVILSMAAAPVFGLKPTSLLSVLGTILTKLPKEEEDDAK